MEFWEHCRNARKKVEQWPEWKRSVRLTNYSFKKDDTMSLHEDILDVQGALAFIDAEAEEAFSNIVDALKTYKQTVSCLTKQIQMLHEAIQTLDDSFNFGD